MAAAGRRLPAVEGNATTIVELIAAYWKFAERHYRKNGEPTKELDNIRYALRPLNKLYGRSLVSEFGPLALKALQAKAPGSAGALSTSESARSSDSFAGR